MNKKVQRLGIFPAAGKNFFCKFNSHGYNDFTHKSIIEILLYKIICHTRNSLRHRYSYNDLQICANHSTEFIATDLSINRLAALFKENRGIQFRFLLFNRIFHYVCVKQQSYLIMHIRHN